LRIILDKLSKPELMFLLDLLNSAGSEIDVFGKSRFIRAIVSPEEATQLDKVADRFRLSYEKGKVSETFRSSDKYYSLKMKDRKQRARNDWSWARIPLISLVVHYRHKEGNFVHWPMIIGVPAHHPAVMINDPVDLVNWLLVRGMANGQLKRLVKCSREDCGKFGIRERSKKDARFCSVKCQKLENSNKAKLVAKARQRETFGMA
jgi:hypothetical protein